MAATMSLSEFFEVHAELKQACWSAVQKHMKMSSSVGRHQLNILMQAVYNSIDGLSLKSLGSHGTLDTPMQQQALASGVVQWGGPSAFVPQLASATPPGSKQTNLASVFAKSMMSGMNGQKTDAAGIAESAPVEADVQHNFGCGQGDCAAAADASQAGQVSRPAVITAPTQEESTVAVNEWLMDPAVQLSLRSLAGPGMAVPGSASVCAPWHVKDPANSGYNSSPQQWLGMPPSGGSTPISQSLSGPPAGATVGGPTAPTQDDDNVAVHEWLMDPAVQLALRQKLASPGTAVPGSAVCAPWNAKHPASPGYNTNLPHWEGLLPPGGSTSTSQSLYGPAAAAIVERAGPYAPSGSMQVGDGNADPFAEYYGHGADGGSCVSTTRYLKPFNALPVPFLVGPNEPLEVSVVRCAELLPLGNPFVTNRREQVDYRYTKSKGASKGVRYCVILKPRTGKGNVTVFLKTRLVSVNASTKTGMEGKLIACVQDWTTTESQ